MLYLNNRDIAAYSYCLIVECFVSPRTKSTKIHVHVKNRYIYCEWINSSCLRWKRNVSASSTQQQPPDGLNVGRHDGQEDHRHGHPGYVGVSSSLQQQLQRLQTKTVSSNAGTLIRFASWIKDNAEASKRENKIWLCFHGSHLADSFIGVRGLMKAAATQHLRWALNHFLGHVDAEALEGTCGIEGWPRV